MLDGPWVAAGHSHFSSGTTICSDPELKHHQTSHPHTNMSFVQWCALEKSAQHVVDLILLYGTCTGDAIGTSLHKRKTDCAMLDTCLSGLGNARGWNKKNPKMLLDCPGVLFNGFHFKVLGQDRSTFSPFTSVGKKRSGVLSSRDSVNTLEIN